MRLAVRDLVATPSQIPSGQSLGLSRRPRPPSSRLRAKRAATAATAISRTTRHRAHYDHDKGIHVHLAINDEFVAFTSYLELRWIFGGLPLKLLNQSGDRLVL